MIGYSSIRKYLWHRHGNDGRKPWERYSCGIAPDRRTLVYHVFLKSVYGATVDEIAALLELPRDEVAKYVKSLFDGKHIFKGKKLRLFNECFGLVYVLYV